MKIIVSIPKPKSHTKEELAWRGIIGETKSIVEDGAKVQVLSEGVWQVDSESGLPVLAYVLNEAELRNFPYQVLFVESGVEWKRSF